MPQPVAWQACQCQECAFMSVNAGNLTKMPAETRVPFGPTADKLHANILVARQLFEHKYLKNF